MSTPISRRIFLALGAFALAVMWFLFRVPETLAHADRRPADWRSVAAGYAAIVESGAAPAAPLTTLGGGSRDPAYVALLADALGIALRPASVADATVVGATRLVMTALGEEMPPVVIDTHGIVEPTGRPLIAERQIRWRQAVERDRQWEGT